MQAIATPSVLNVGGTAHELGVSERTVWNLVLSGELGSIRIGRRRLVPRQAIEAYVARQMTAQEGVLGDGE